MERHFAPSRFVPIWTASGKEFPSGGGSHGYRSIEFFFFILAGNARKHVTTPTINKFLKISKLLSRWEM